jgi:hypothetical protein
MPYGEDTHTYMYWSYQCMMGGGRGRGWGKGGRGCILTISIVYGGEKIKIKA